MPGWREWTSSDGLGGTLGEFTLGANPDGYAELLAWADGLGAVAVFGVEGTGSYVSGLARFLRPHGLKVIEVSRPPRKGEGRLSGKSDTIDAEHAARELLAGKATATPKLADGIVEAIRLVKIARDSAVKAHSQAIITLKATLVTASDELRSEAPWWIHGADVPYMSVGLAGGSAGMGPPCSGSSSYCSSSESCSGPSREPWSRAGTA